MALFNEILIGRYNRALQKVTGIKGQAPAPQLAAEITPGILIASGNENRYLESWQTYGVNQTIGAVAAQNSAARLRNPSGSNVIGVLIKVAAWSASIEQPLMDLAVVAADLGTITPGPRFDARGPQKSVLVASLGNNVAASTTIASFTWLANQGYDFVQDAIQEIPLLPGDALTVRSNQVNVTFNCVFWWRERFLEESERA